MVDGVIVLDRLAVLDRVIVVGRLGGRVGWSRRRFDDLRAAKRLEGDFARVERAVRKLEQRYAKLANSDAEMRAIRAHPEIQRWEAWRMDTKGKPYTTDLKNNAEIHRRRRHRRADLFEMVARDEDIN